MSNFTFTLERHWSCPVHKESVTMFADDPWNEEGEICLDCLTGKWVVTKDEDGWATMTFRRKTAMDHLHEAFFESLRSAINRSSYGDLLGEKAVIEWQ